MVWSSKYPAKRIIIKRNAGRKKLKRKQSSKQKSAYKLARKGLKPQGSMMATKGTNSTCKMCHSPGKDDIFSGVGCFRNCALRFPSLTQTRHAKCGTPWERTTTFKCKLIPRYIRIIFKKNGAYRHESGNHNMLSRPIGPIRVPPAIRDRGSLRFVTIASYKAHITSSGYPPVGGCAAPKTDGILPT